ncbi:ABC transporter transmembrane domain-containing protein [Deinococcus lacus]|uniref:ABC transporter transmembrane domain-containing protein n=1 Tax=Deinococcus lacus TaxID=392561 RepID=A0ABW1YGK4_9DEIO
MTTPATFPLARRLMSYRPRLFWLNVLLWAAVHTLPAAVSWAVSRVFARLAETQPGEAWSSPGMLAVWGALGIFALLRLARFGLFYAAFLTFIEFIYTAGALLRRNLLGYLLTAQGPRQLPDTPAEAVSRFRDDVEDVNAYVEAWIDASGFILYAAVAIALMARIDPWITLMVCAPLLLMVALVSRLSPVIRQYRRRMREATARVTDFIGETFGAVSAVKLAGQEAHMVAHLRHLGETRRQAALRDVLLTELIRGVNANMVNVAVGAVLLLGANQVRGGQMGPEDFVLFTALLPRLTGAMAFLVTGWPATGAPALASSACSAYWVRRQLRSQSTIPSISKGLPRRCRCQPQPQSLSRNWWPNTSRCATPVGRV